MSAIVVGAFEGFRKLMAPRTIGNRVGLTQQQVRFSFPMAFIVTQGSTASDTGWLNVGFKVPAALDNLVDAPAFVAANSWETVGEEIRDRARRIEEAVAQGMAPAVAGEELYRNKVGSFDKASDFRLLAVKQFGLFTEIECVNKHRFPVMRIGLRNPGELNRVSKLFSTILQSRFVGR